MNESFFRLKRMLPVPRTEQNLIQSSGWSFPSQHVLYMHCGNILCPSLSIRAALMQTSAKAVEQNQRLHGSDRLCNIIFWPRGECGLMSVCLPPCALGVTRRKWGSWIMITVWGWQPLQRESVTFVSLLHHKCLEGEQLSPPICLSNMNNKQYAVLNVFVGHWQLSTGKFSHHFLFYFFPISPGDKKREFCHDQ